MNRFTSLLKDAAYHINKVDNDSSLNPEFRRLYEQQRVQLLRAVSRAVKQVLVEHTALSASSADKDNIVIRSGKPTFQLCSCCEIVLRHGLKQGILNFGAKPNFWSVAKLVSRKQAIEYIVSLDQAKSDLGRCRAWLRLAINENSLQSYITTILRDVSLTRYYYDRHAFLLDVDKAEAMAMMIAGIADFNLDMPVNTPALEFEPTPLAQMWGPLSKAPMMNKEGTGAGAEGSRPHKKVRKKRASGPSDITEAHADTTQRVQCETSLQPLDVERGSSENHTRPANVDSNGQFADEERWFRELMAPDTQVAYGSREEIEMMESHQLRAFKEAVHEQVGRDTMEDTESHINSTNTTDKKDNPAAETAVINEEQEQVSKKETSCKDNEVTAIEMCDTDKRDSDVKDGGAEEPLSIDGKCTGTGEYVVGLLAAGAVDDCYNETENKGDSRVEDTSTVSTDGHLDDGNHVADGDQLESEMPLDVTEEAVEEIVFETKEGDSALTMTTDVASSAVTPLESESPNQTFIGEKESRLSAVEAPHESLNCQPEDLLEEDNKTSDEAIKIPTVVDTHNELSCTPTAKTPLQVHEGNVCEDETASILIEVQSYDVQTDENSEEIGALSDTVMSHDVSVEYCGNCTIDATHNISQVSISQSEIIESEDVPGDGDGVSEGSENEGEELTPCFLQSMGQNDLSRYLTWNDDMSELSEQSVVNRLDLTLDLVNTDKREASESEVTLTEIVVSPYENKEIKVPDHLTTEHSNSLVESGHEQPGTDDLELNSLLSTYDVLPDVPESIMTIGTQSEAIGAEFKATVKELQLPDTFDVQKLINFNDDHFSQPELLGPNATIQELYHAVENRVGKFKTGLKMSQSEKERLVMEIVQLRLQIQELQESHGEAPASKVVLGHRLLRKGKSPGIKRHCDHCKTIIWCIIQTWYQCEGCKYSCHRKCVSFVSRTCPLTKATDMKFITDICPERGLSDQQYKCVECRRKISFQPKGAVSDAHLCDYTGHYYCDNCHWNDMSFIPARIIHNWDFTLQKVCRQGKQILSMTSLRACINIQQLNPMLFNYVTELAEIRKLREEMLVMKKYFLSCQAALECGLLNLLQERQHFKESSDTYSLQDLMDLASGVLIPEINDIHRKFASHIRNDCHLCQAKGFICEICRANHVIFHFDMDAGMCPECSAVFHRACINSNQCPKCLRLSQRKQEKL